MKARTLAEWESGVEDTDAFIIKKGDISYHSFSSVQDFLALLGAKGTDSITIVIKDGGRHGSENVGVAIEGQMVGFFQSMCLIADATQNTLVFAGMQVQIHEREDQDDN